MKKTIPHSKPDLGPIEQRAASRVIASGQVAQGLEVERFEREAGAFLRTRYAAAVTSGTTGLELSLRALNIRSGDEVLIPSFVCSALWHAVKWAGARPVLADCAAGELNLSVADARRKMTRRTRAVILPHMFGAPADVKGALKLGIPVIEDCALALGASVDGRRLGGFGAMGVLSFYATKLMTTGEGGMIVSNKREYIERVRAMREYDCLPPTETRENSKMTDIQAAIGRVQLKRLPQFLRRRAEIARTYDRAFAELAISLPSSEIGRVYHRYIIRAPEKIARRLLERLPKSGIGARKPVFRPLHMDLGGKFPEADRAWRESVSLPIYPSLSDDDQRRIIRAVKDCLVL